MMNRRSRAVAALGIFSIVAASQVSVSPLASATPSLASVDRFLERADSEGIQASSEGRRAANPAAVSLGDNLNGLRIVDSSRKNVLLSTSLKGDRTWMRVRSDISITYNKGRGSQESIVYEFSQRNRGTDVHLEKVEDQKFWTEQQEAVRRANAPMEAQEAAGPRVQAEPRFVRSMEEMKERERPHDVATRKPTAFNPAAAKQYADTYWQNYNPNYPVFDPDNDCANFVSQALKAGGWENHAPGLYDDPPNLAEYLVPSSWFYIKGLIPKDASRTWTFAPAQYEFPLYHDDRGTFWGDGIPREGDVIFFDWTSDGSIDHSAIVTGRDNEIGETYVTYHTTNQHDRPLGSIWNDLPDMSIVLLQLS